MNCKFLKHGLSISYEAITQPCCVFKYDEKNSLSVYDTNLSTYHDSDYLKSLSTQMQNGVWPKECVRCQVLELQNKTSMRQNGNEAYKNYNNVGVSKVKNGKAEVRIFCPDRYKVKKVFSQLLERHFHYRIVFKDTGFLSPVMSVKVDC